MNSRPKKNTGYITLLSVLIVGTVGLAVTISLISLGLSNSLTSLDYQQMYQAKNLTNACVEEGLEKIRELSTFTGSGNLTMGQGACSYNIINTGGDTRQVTATGTVATIVKKATVSITAINPLIIISSWQEN